MKTKIFEGLKTKAVAYGFNQAELTEMAEVISATLTVEATDEQVGAAIDGFIPFLKTFQKATTRQVEAVKPKTEVKAEVKADPTEQKAGQATDDRYAALEKKFDSLMETVTGQQTAQANEKRRALAMEKLKDVPKGYTIGLTERNFDTDDAVDTYANAIIESHKADEAARTQQTAGAYVPGRGQNPSTDEKVSPAVQARIDAKRKEAGLKAPVIDSPQIQN